MAHLNKRRFGPAWKVGFHRKTAHFVEKQHVSVWFCCWNVKKHVLTKGATSRRRSCRGCSCQWGPFGLLRADLWPNALKLELNRTISLGFLNQNMPIYRKVPFFIKTCLFSNEIWIEAETMEWNWNMLFFDKMCGFDASLWPVKQKIHFCLISSPEFLPTRS